MIRCTASRSALLSLAFIAGCYRVWTPTTDGDASLPDAGQDSEADGETNDGSTTADASEPSDGGVYANIDTGFCDPTLVDWPNASIYADSRGVYVLAGGSMEPPVVETRDRRLYQRTEEAWQRLMLTPAPVYTTELASSESGPFFEYGTGNCALRKIDDGTSRCAAAFSEITSVVTVSPERAFGTYRDHVIHYDGTLWRELGAALPERPRAIWSDGTSLVLGLMNGVLVGSISGEWQTHSVIPSLERLELVVGIAGTDANDLYWTARGKLFRFGGASWTHAWTSRCEATSSDAQTFGGVPYFWGDTYIGRIEAGSPRVLVEWPCETEARITDVSVDPSSGDVWAVSVGHAGAACGEVIVHHWEHDAFRR